MSEEKSSPTGIIVVVAVIAVVAAFFVGKSGGGNGDQAAGNQQQPTNGSDKNQTTQLPSPKKKENGPDANQTTPQPEPPKPEKPAEPEEPAFVKEGLVAYYLFNGNANDESGNGHDGEAKGAVLAADRHGEDGKAYSFDGKDDFIEVPDSDDLDLGNKTGKEWTVAIWFKGNIKREGWLLRKGGSGGSRTTDYGVIASPNPVHRGFIWGTGRSAGAGGNDVTDWMAIPSNVGSDEWHHVVATYKQGGLNEGFKIFYIDGQVAGSTDSGKLKNPANDGSTRIGNGWQGLIDDVRIFNRALSEEQVKALFDLEKPTGSSDSAVRPKSKHDLTEGLVAYYPFNGNAKDESGNGNDGEVKGATLVKDRHGEEGKTFRFDGKDDFIEVPDSDSVDFGTKQKGWTISAWIDNRGANAAGAQGGTIIGKDWKHGSLGTDYIFAAGAFNVKPVKYQLGITASRKVGSGGGAHGLNGGWDAVNLPEEIDVNGWHHFVATANMETKTKHLFINGREFDSLKFERKNRAHNGPLKIGSGHSARSSLWNGDIDDVRIYNRALAAAEVTELYDLEKPKE